MICNKRSTRRPNCKPTLRLQTYIRKKQGSTFSYIDTHTAAGYNKLTANHPTGKGSDRYAVFAVSAVLHLPEGQKMAGRPWHRLHPAPYQRGKTYGRRTAAVVARSGCRPAKFFNTSGLVYRSLGLKDKLDTMTEEEQIALLATDGMLVKRRCW